MIGVKLPDRELHFHLSDNHLTFMQLKPRALRYSILNCQTLEAVSPHRDPQLLVNENYTDLSYIGLKDFRHFPLLETCYKCANRATEITLSRKAKKTSIFLLYKYADTAF